MKFEWNIFYFGRAANDNGCIQSDGGIISAAAPKSRSRSEELSLHICIYTFFIFLSQLYSLIGS